MALILGAYIAAQALELLGWQRWVWSKRTGVMPVLFVLILATAVAMVIAHPTIFSAALAIISAYRLLNLTRVIAGRMQPEYLRRATWRTSWWLAVFSLAAVAFWYFMHSLQIDSGSFWLLVMGLEIILAVILLSSTLRHARSMHPSDISEWFRDSDLPTLTVAVPARNETEDLQYCLSTLTKSKYPKLEIIVLDDCSTVRRTPEVIRQFAHDGVRFIKGKEPDDKNWLPKNLAYQRLLEEANGELVLFAGADTRFEPQTLNHIVTLMVNKKKSMMSIMPRNILPAFKQLDASMIQPMRYAWEIALPRKLFRRPPVLSTCWIAKREVLLSSGGFSAVSRSIQPESYFARQSVRHDGYSFRYSSARMGLTSHKAISDQRDTATRTKYPQLHRRPEFVLLMSVIELFGMVIPFLLLVASLVFADLGLVFAVSAVSSALYIIWFMTVCTLTYRQPDVRSLVSLPFAVAQDVALLNYSMLKYEFSVVLWKDRNVCVPIMRVEPKLPAMDDQPHQRHHQASSDLVN